MRAFLAPGRTEVPNICVPNTCVFGAARRCETETPVLTPEEKYVLSTSSKTFTESVGSWKTDTRRNDIVVERRQGKG
jgi:hypothetical protein